MTDSIRRDRPLRQSKTLLLATDSKNSVLAEVTDGKVDSIAYSAYGEQSGRQGIGGRLGFNGQLREARLGWYLLGNGYRAYNPVLMRFHSPDSWSPFGEGGLNAYMYCVGDPVNASDPTGHIKFFGHTRSPDLSAINAAAAARRPQFNTSNDYQALPTHRRAAPTSTIQASPASSPETVPWEEYFSERSSSFTQAERSQTSIGPNSNNSVPRPAHSSRPSSNTPSSINIATISNSTSGAPPLPPRLNLPTPPPLPPKRDLPQPPPLPSRRGPPLPPRRTRDVAVHGSDQVTQTMEDVRRPQ